jgi:hypothetical protein
MFSPEPVERDKYGFWYHSALKNSEEEDLTEIDGAEDMEFSLVSFEDDAPEELRELYAQALNVTHTIEGVPSWEQAVKAWQPTTPEGAGWFLFGIYDTEDGPYACFTRPKESEASGGLTHADEETTERERH